eukprot:XP_016656678.1 PREDICTED: uncharacterized protein LOC107882601 [Acyrthosiphon pisum]
MWSIVEFENENTIEVVPAHWVKNNVCAWPKKDVKKNVERRVLSNKFDFNYFASRTLKKNIATLTEARAKLKKAEHTSDLSTCDDEMSKSRTNKSKVLDPPTYSYNKSISPKSNATTNHTQETITNSHSLDRPTFKEKKNSYSIDRSSLSQLDVESKEGHKKKYESTYQNASYSLPLKAKRKLFDRNSFSPIPALPREHNINTSSRYNHQSDVNNSPVSVTSIKVEPKRALSTEIIHTSSSPFKVSKVVQDDTSDYPNYELLDLADINLQSSFKKVSSNNTQNKQLKSNCLAQTSESNAYIFMFVSDVMNKILRVVLKIKYDVEAIAQNQLQMDKILTDTVLQAKENENNYEELFEYDSFLPIENEDQLDEFETKLQNKNFRRNIVNGLKRLAKKTLTGTIRQMLRKIFEDDILQMYSFVGQKKKKIFSSLGSCSIIIEAVRKIKAFENATNSEIEGPMKIYLAGAAFRKKKIL